MTTRAALPAVPHRTYPRRRFGVGAIVDKARTTGPRVIGLMYAVSTFVFFVIGGLLVLLMRAGLAPGIQSYPSSSTTGGSSSKGPSCY